MRVALPLIALLFATGASAQQAKTVPLRTDPSAAAERSQKNCRDRIQEVRQERGLPRLERDAGAADPLMILAVHRTIDGCSVLVTVNDEIRPLPEPREPRLMRAR